MSVAAIRHERPSVVTAFSTIVILISLSFCMAESPNQIRQRLHLPPNAPIPEQEIAKQSSEVDKPADESISLDDCGSDGFNAARCEQEVTDFEQQFKPLSSAPDEGLQLLAAGYHNLGYASEDPTQKAKWQKKEKELFEEVFKNAKTANRFYVASTMVAAEDHKEECLKNALLLDPDHFNARRALMDLYLDEGKMRNHTSFSNRFINPAENSTKVLTC